MYATLYDAFKDIFGVSWPVLKLLQSFGFFVAVAFLFASWLFARELRRKEALGLLQPSFTTIKKGVPAPTSELVIQFVIGFLVGYKLLGLFFAGAEAGADPRNYLLSSKGNIFLGIAGGAALAYWRWRESEKERKEFPEPKELEHKISPAEHVGNMTLLAAGFGFLGAKLFHILENFREFLHDPSEMIFSFSGLTMYGGLILGGGAVLWYARKKKLNLWHVMDACAPGLILAYGIGRMGCHVAGDGDWGVVNTAPKPGWMSFLPDWFWAYSYPHNVNSEGVRIPGCLEEFHCSQLPQPVFPTPMYESLLGILIFVILWQMRKKISTPGLLFSIYLIFNGLERFFIELIRVNNTLFSIGSFRVTQAEFIALTLVLLGLFGVYYTRKNNRPSIPAA